MSRDISEIPGLTGKTLVLFRASGFVTAASLLERSAPEIVKTLGATNGEYGIVGWLPSPGAVQAWVSTARVLEDVGDEEDSGPMSEDEIAQVRETAVMVARPVLGGELKEAGVAVDAVPIAIFVGDNPRTRVLGENSVVTHIHPGASKRRARRSRAGSDTAGGEERSEYVEPGEGVDYQEAILPNGSAIPHAAEDGDHEAEEDEIQYIDEPSLHFRDTESLALLNKGNERRNNGMTHKSPVKAYTSALATMVSMLVGWSTLVAVIGLAIFFAQDTGKIPAWLPFLMMVIPVCILIYATLGRQARCRLCGYRLFSHMSCRKHEKAHRSLFGSIFATAWRLLARGTWRCMYCGTKQKLK